VSLSQRTTSKKIIRQKITRLMKSLLLEVEEVEVEEAGEAEDLGVMVIPGQRVIDHLIRKESTRRKES
jgi:hypothetical protein